MTASLREVTDQALQLLPADRIDLAESLLESVADFVDPQIEDHWRRIAVRRLAEHESGRVEGIPAAEVHRRIREGLHEGRLSSRG